MDGVALALTSESPDELRKQRQTVPRALQVATEAYKTIINSRLQRLLEQDELADVRKFVASLQKDVGSSRQSTSSSSNSTTSDDVRRLGTTTYPVSIENIALAEFAASNAENYSKQFIASFLELSKNVELLTLLSNALSQEALANAKYNESQTSLSDRALFYSQRLILGLIVGLFVGLGLAFFIDTAKVLKAQ